MASGNGLKDRLDSQRVLRESSESRVERIADDILSQVPGSDDWECCDEMKDWIVAAVDAESTRNGLDDGQREYLFDCVSGSGVFPVLVD